MKEILELLCIIEEQRGSMVDAVALIKQSQQF
jgi:hypothetical protein